MKLPNWWTKIHQAKKREIMKGKKREIRKGKNKQTTKILRTTCLKSFNKLRMRNGWWRNSPKKQRLIIAKTVLINSLKLTASAIKFTKEDKLMKTVEGKLIKRRRENKWNRRKSKLRTRRREKKWNTRKRSSNTLPL